MWDQGGTTVPLLGSGLIGLTGCGRKKLFDVPFGSSLEVGFQISFDPVNDFQSAPYLISLPPPYLAPLQLSCGLTLPKFTYIITAISLKGCSSNSRIEGKEEGE
jgi:hypothetical protein